MINAEMNSKIFPVLILLARPGAGKSEILRYLREIDPQDRLHRFHIGRMEEIDDFPFLWTWFEEDDLLTQMGLRRLHSTEDGYFSNPEYWHLLIRRIGLEYQKKLRDTPGYHDSTTSLIEFSRGTEHGGYRQAFLHILPDIAANASILYIQVSFAESLRKNLKRADPLRPDSILQHSLSVEKMERLYKDTDWEEIAPGVTGTTPIQGFNVPYIVMENEDDLTTAGGPALGQRLEACLHDLWMLHQAANLKRHVNSS